MGLMNKINAEEDQEVAYLQERHRRLGCDRSYRDLCNYVDYLRRKYKV